MAENDYPMTDIERYHADRMADLAHARAYQAKRVVTPVAAVYHFLARMAADG